MRIDKPAMAKAKGFEYWVGRRDSPDPLQREATYRALGELGDARAVEPLIRGLRDKVWYVRRAACKALAGFGDVRGMEPPIERLEDDYPYVRHASCLLRAADWLVEQLVGGDPDGRYASFRALEFVGEALDARQLFCGSCLARFQQLSYHLKGVGTVSIPACRLCGNAGNAIRNVREVVAVLDTETRQELSCADGVARVSYLKRDAPFDFDWVEIVRAGDYEVERFCVQVGNDADPFRKGRYRQMRCAVAPGCQLSENTLRILRSMFGRVEVHA